MAFLTQSGYNSMILFFLTITMSNTNIITLFLQTSLAVQIVVVFLVVLALVSWFLIFRVAGKINGLERFDAEFENWLWNGESLQAQFQMVNNDFNRVGLEQIFYIGYDEFITVQKITNNHAYVLQVTERKFNIILAKQKIILKEGLSTLANISTVAPYLGILGAIWGMVGALGLTDNLTFGIIVPDIIEALLIVALGLFIAISTKWAVNYFHARIEDVHDNRVLFCEELISVLSHQHMIAQKALQLTQLPALAPLENSEPVLIPTETIAKPQPQVKAQADTQTKAHVETVAEPKAEPQVKAQAEPKAELEPELLFEPLMFDAEPTTPKAKAQKTPAKEKSTPELELELLSFESELDDFDEFSALEAELSLERETIVMPQAHAPHSHNLIK